MPTRRQRKSRRGEPKRHLWPWVGLGALGVATVWMSSRPRPGPAPVLPPLHEGPPTRLPDGVELAWIPGPAGALRLAERHPGGRLAVVFVHGLGGRLEQWSAQLAGLGPALRALALDLPGHGESDAAADGDYSVPALAAAVGAALDAGGLRRAVLVGHSLGALAAIEYAAGHPERVAALLLVDPSGDQTRMPPADRSAWLAAVRDDPRGECDFNFRHFLGEARPEVAKAVLESLEATPAAALVAALEGSAAYAAAAAMERYPGPAASVVSELNDLPISLHRLRPELPARRLRGVSHWLMMDRPSEVLEALWDLLERI
jgi:pimeloyl-ACP methyl ester carboxylesterase